MSHLSDAWGLTIYNNDVNQPEKHYAIHDGREPRCNRGLALMSVGRASAAIVNTPRRSGWMSQVPAIEGTPERVLTAVRTRISILCRLQSPHQ